MLIRKCPTVSSQSAWTRSRSRKGSVLPFLALVTVVLCGFLALAIDLGMLTIAKAQAQNAADLAALTAARTLNGSSSVSPYNNQAATSNAETILSYNAILRNQIQSSQLTLTYGSYDYSQTSQTFSANYPPTSGAAWTAVAATVTSGNIPGAFSTIFGSPFLPTVSCTAQAVHRPRDIALTLDLSSSMLFGSCLAFDPNTSSKSTNNPDTLVPAFGQYATNSSLLIGPSTSRTSASDNYTITPTNTTVANSSYSSIYINSFYQNAAYASTLVRAFDSYTSTDAGNTWTAPTGSATPQLPPSSYAATPGGEVPLFKFGSSTTYAQTVNDVLGTSSTNTAANMMWELDGYSAYANGKPDTSGAGSTPQVWAQADYSTPTVVGSSNYNANYPTTGGSLPFNGYTQGPGYYGKTFFLWPPDPRNNSGVSGTTLTGYLNALGITNSTDQTTLSDIWATWQGQGAAGLTNLQKWLKGTATGGASSLPKISGGNYSSTKVPGVTSWNGATLTTANQPSTYYAVCRLFNRSYPYGAAWTSSSQSADWRVRYFGTSDNSALFNSSGSLNPPGSTGMSSAATTYNNILGWLQGAPNPFPTQMRAGRIKYYGSIPSSLSGSWPTWKSTDQEFWQQVIDSTLGFKQTASGTYSDISGIGATSAVGYGTDFAWGTVSIASSPNPPAPSPSTAPQTYMNYKDNPARPLLRYWFGPLLTTDFLIQQSYDPGDGYQAPSYSCKQAYLAAISTMQNNHPNDWFTIVPFSQPRNLSWDTKGRNNNVYCPLGTNYTYAQSALLFPFSTINADGSCNNTEVTPFDVDPSSGTTPSATFKDIARPSRTTCFAMALMLIHNQFASTPASDTTLRSYVSTSPINFPTGMAGGLGRKGAQKVVIFETDGMADEMASANLVTNGSYTYYQVRYDMNNSPNSEYPTNVTNNGINDPSTLSQVYTLVSTLSSTYGTTRNPFRLYGIGFGPVFSGPDATIAQSTLVNMQNYANGTSITSLPSSQIITGTDAQMSTNMVSAFTSILENGVQIALIK